MVLPFLLNKDGRSTSQGSAPALRKTIVKFFDDRFGVEAFLLQEITD